MKNNSLKTALTYLFLFVLLIFTGNLVACRHTGGGGGQEVSDLPTWAGGNSGVILPPTHPSNPTKNLPEMRDISQSPRAQYLSSMTLIEMPANRSGLPLAWKNEVAAYTAGVLNAELLNLSRKEAPGAAKPDKAGRRNILLNITFLSPSTASLENTGIQRIRLRSTLADGTIIQSDDVVGEISPAWSHLPQGIVMLIATASSIFILGLATGANLFLEDGALPSIGLLAFASGAFFIPLSLLVPLDFIQRENEQIAMSDLYHEALKLHAADVNRVLSPHQ